MLTTLKRLAAVTPVVFLLLALGAHPAYADQTVIDSVDASPNTATEGDTVTFTDVVTLSGTTAPTGDVTFSFYPNSNCAGPAIFSGTATLTSTSATTSTATFTSPSWTAEEGDDFHWQVSYDGAGTQDPVDDDCDETDQRVIVSPAAVVSKATPTLTGEADPQTVTEGEEVELTDTATLNGADTPTGSIVFALFDNDECDEDGLVFEADAPIVGSTATFSDTFTPTDPGTYYWALFYEGDALNEEAESICDDPKQRLLVRGAAFEGPGQTPGPDTPVLSPGGGADPEVTADGDGDVLPVTGPAPVDRIAQGALAVLMLGLATMLMAGSPRRI